MMPADFVWGAATAAYQIEGATREDGRGESIWDAFAARPGHIADGSSGEPADDHYHRVREDVSLMRDLGLHAYRFSIAWPRIQPSGRGAPNRAGLDFYEALVERLLESGIRPFATLYHWDLPQALQDRGGWRNRDTVERFAEYADLVSYRLGDRVHDWITLNEPWVSAYLGHVTGEHAPGLTDPVQYPRVAHHLLLAHGTAVPIVRGNGRGGPVQVGVTLNLSPAEPASERNDNVRAAQMHDGLLNRWYLDPLFRGSYPADILEIQPFPQDMEIETGEMERIATPIDFLGVNYYTRALVELGPDERPRGVKPRTIEGRTPEYTEMDWEVYPEGLYQLLTRLTRDYNPPCIYVTENGAAFADTVDPEGQVRDPRRVAYLEGHVEAMERAVGAGVPLAGYFAWSLFDNWEWAYGYTKRFGIVHVDYETQKRTIKESGRWYARLIAGDLSR